MSNCAIERGITTEQLQASLLQLFGPHLGIYTLPGGETIPALWVIKTGKVRPDLSCTGTELVLTETPERVPMGGRGTLLFTRMWSLRFTCFDTTQSLDSVRLLCCRAWPQVKARHRPQDDNTYEQLVLELPDPVLIQPL